MNKKAELPSNVEESVLVGTPPWKDRGEASQELGGATATFDGEMEPASDAVMPTVEALRVRTEDRLEDFGVLARGGFGAVHRVRDRTLRRMVAMKVMDPVKAKKDTAVMRFIEEAQITGQLDHPNIVPVHELGVDEQGRYFFSMKMVRGDTLTAILKRHGDFPTFHDFLDHVLEILGRVCDALAFAHNRGVIHRDLKPDNIMVGTFGQVYVMDWGIAMLTAQARPSGAHDSDVIETAKGARDAPGTVIGTFSYMAPEQAQGRNDQLDARTDVFGLGAMLYQVLTGRPPYEGKTPLEKVMAAQKTAFTPPAKATDRELPAVLVQVCMKAMKANPDERFQGVMELKKELERFRHGAFFPTQAFPPGAMIVTEGDEADAAYIMVSGSCEAFKMDGGRKVPLRTMGPGEVFGETAIFTSKPRTASVRAVTPVVAMVVTRESLEEELGSLSWMASFVKALAARFREQDQSATGLRTITEDGRILNRALEYLAFNGRSKDETRVAPWAMLRQTLTREFGKAEAELVAALDRSASVRVDRDADRVVLSPASV